MSHQIKDAQLEVALTLPNGAATTNSAGLDLGNSDRGHFIGEVELVISAPALTTGQLGDGQTITYSVRHGAASDFSGDAELLGGLIVQTGAGGAGAAAAEKRIRLPSNVARYLRVRAVKTGASNASTAEASAALLF